MKKLRIVGLALSVGLLAGHIQAGTTQLSVTDAYGGWGGFNVSQNSGGSFSGVNAGAFRANYVSGAALPAVPAGFGNANSFISYCLDLGNSGVGGWYTSGTFPNPNAGNGNPTWQVGGIYNAAYLYNTYQPTVDSAANQKQYGEALQLAIWEVLYDTAGKGSYDLNGGNFQGTSTLGGQTIAAGWLSALNNLAVVPQYTTTYWDTTTSAGGPDTGRQALIGPVPEPAEIALMLAAIGGIAAGYRRVRKVRTEAPVAA